MIQRVNGYNVEKKQIQTIKLIYWRFCLNNNLKPLQGSSEGGRPNRFYWRKKSSPARQPFGGKQNPATAVVHFNFSLPRLRFCWDAKMRKAFRAEGWLVWRFSVIKSFCHLHSWGRLAIDAICDALHETSLIFQRRESIVLLYMLRKSFNWTDHNSAGFLSYLHEKFWGNFPILESPSFGQRKSTALMIHTFSMWPTLRNTIYLPEITLLGHRHWERSFPAPTQVQQINVLFILLHVFATIWRRCYLTTARDGVGG